MKKVSFVFLKDKHFNLEETFKNDPANFIKMTSLTHEIKNLILEYGPCQPYLNDMPEKDFPKTNKRSFNDTHRRIPKGPVSSKNSQNDKQ